MLRRQGIAFVRNLALLGLGLVGLAMSVLLIVAATLVVPYLPAARVAKRLADLGRRLTGSWGGLPVEVERRPGPPAPERWADGWYVHENELYKSPRLPAYLLELAWRSEDPALLREWLWLHLTPFVGGLAVLVPPTLATAGVGLGTLGLAGGAAPVVGAPSPAWAVPVGLALVALGFALAPMALRLHARWSRLLLGPSAQFWWTGSRAARWLRKGSDDTWHGGGLSGLGFAALGGTLLNLVTLLVAWGGLSPQVSHLTRPLVSRYRRYAGRGPA